MTKNSIGMELSYIPSGNFKMGSPAAERSRGRDEEQVDVTISMPFLMASTEVTQKQWSDVMGVTLKELIETMKGPLGRGANLKSDPSAMGDEQPMCFVSYEDAINFCAKLTEMDTTQGLLAEGFVYTLPSEAQWEYASRAGTTTVFPQGDTLDGNQANFYSLKPYGDEGKVAMVEYRKATTPVKTFAANPWNLYDMQGNVYEWCLDFYTETLAGGTDPSELTEGDSRNIRGGAFNKHASSSRSAYRYSYDASQRTRSIGFRVILAKE